MLVKTRESIVWRPSEPIYTIPNATARNLISLNSKYSSLLTAGFSSTHYKINNLAQYKSQLGVDENTHKHQLEVGVSTSTVTYPGYKIYRWFDNSKTIEFYNALSSADSAYKSTGTITVAIANKIKEFNPMYNSCLIIGSDTVTIRDVEEFEKYLKDDLTEQTALRNKFPQSTWFNTNSWQGYGYSELTETWAMSIEHLLAVMSQKNWGSVPDAYKNREKDEARFYCKATSKSDAKDPYNYFGNYLPAYLTQLAIESEISALKKKMYGYDTYPYALKSKGSLFFENLPSTASKGDTYTVSNAFKMNDIIYPIGTNVTWSGTEWVITEDLATHTDGIQDRMDKQSLYKSQIVEEISWEKNLSFESRMELSAFIREEELSDDNFLVTDAMTEEERQEMLQSFIDFGEKELSKVCVPQLSFSATIANLFSIPEFDNVSMDFEPGNSIYVTLRDDFHVKAMLLTIHMNFYNPEDFTLKFSDILKKSDGLYTDLQNAINDATSAASSVTFNSDNWSSGSITASRISGALEKGLLSQGAYLSDNPAQSTFTITDIGVFVDTASGEHGKFDVFGEPKFVYDSIYIGGGRILFTDDGWKHVRMSLGRSEVIKINPHPSRRQDWEYTTEEFGVFADFVISGYIGGTLICGGRLCSDVPTYDNYGNIVPVSEWDLETGRIKIYDSSGFKEPVLSFDGNTLSIKGIIKATGGEIGGFNITTEKLYGNGIEISPNQLKYGSNFVVTSDGIMTAKDGTFSGTINSSTINSGKINGGSININNKFIVDSEGNLTATSANITGSITSSNVNITGGTIGGWTITADRITGGITTLLNNGYIQIGSVSLTDKSNYSSGTLFIGGNIQVNDIFLVGYLVGGEINCKDIYCYDIRPDDETRYCGSKNYKWKEVWAKNGEIQTSDRNRKHSIYSLSDKYESMFFDLKPVTYHFDNGDRTHVGFISQDVEESMDKVNLTGMDFAGFCKDIRTKFDENKNEVEVYDDDGNPIYDYSLRYSEFIALNTHMIQKLYKRVDELEKEIERIKHA